jgi:hypothetical protein
MSASDISRRFEPPGYLDVLVVCSAPVDVPPLELESELSGIKEEMQRASIPIRLIRVFPPTFAQLEKELSAESPRSQRPRAFHFLGHGEHDRLVFETEYGSNDPVAASQLCELFRVNPIDLAVLNACWSHSPLWEGLCKVLTDSGGVRTAIGHRLTANDGSAIVFARSFYREVFRGSDVDTAKETAVKALQDAKLPRGDQILTSGDGGLRLGNNLAPRQGAGCFVHGMPRRGSLPDREFFRGRSDEYLRISRSLADSEHRAFGVWGMGGIGKTALALEAAHRSAWRYREGGVVWVDARAVNSPTTHALLHLALERLLPEADPSDPDCELIRHLKSAPGLIVLDNLENLPKFEYDSLVRFLDQIPTNGSRAILTNRIPIPQVDRLLGPSQIVLTRGLDPWSGTHYVYHLAQTEKVEALLAPPVADDEGHPNGLCAWLNECLSGHPQMIVHAVTIARTGLKALEAELASLSGVLSSQLEAMVKTGMECAGEEGCRLLSCLTFFESSRFTLGEMETVCSVSRHKRGADLGNATSDEADNQSWLARGLQQLMDGGLLELDRKQSVYTFHKTLIEYARRLGAPDQGRKRRTRLLFFYLTEVRAHQENNRAIDRWIENARALMEEIWEEEVGRKDSARRRKMALLIELVEALGDYFRNRPLWPLAESWHVRLIELFRDTPEPIRGDARLAEELHRYANLLWRQRKINEARETFEECIDREVTRWNGSVLLMALVDWIQHEEVDQWNSKKDLVEKLRRLASEILQTLGEEGIEP